MSDGAVLGLNKYREDLMEDQNMETKRSRLAEVLGVEDGQEFKTEGGCWKYVVEHRSLWRIHETGNRAQVSGPDICWLINHPEKIHPIPKYSEKTIQAARAAELLGFEEVSRDSGGDLLLRHPGDCVVAGHQNMFPEIKPGQTIPLSEIK